MRMSPFFFPNRREAFTLIELLIVVAIIAILAAIAVPNFLEAQVRSKVARVKSDQRTLATGLESYYVDHNKYPPEDDPNQPGMGGTIFVELSLIRLTTPVAYLATLSQTNDPFMSNTAMWNPDTQTWTRTHSFVYCEYQSFALNRPGQCPPPIARWNMWVAFSLGPDKMLGGTASRIYNAVSTPNVNTERQMSWGVYDPSNGTISYGDIVRVGGEIPSIINQMVQK
ncbi:MAG: prepilin-type N-terminal cleavage/methylation domain-containing protein [bacterium]|nr:prepilin-type N-terminal cleavage/methylation domain-containing protein [bacterium]